MQSLITNTEYGFAKNDDMNEKRIVLALYRIFIIENTLKIDGVMTHIR